MAIQLFGNNYNPQATGNPMGQTYNPLQVANPTQPAVPKIVAPAAPRAVAPRPVAVAAPRVPTAQPIAINPTYAQYVQTRPSPSNPGVLEYFNPQNGIGFERDTDVFNYLRTVTGQNITNLNQLSAPQPGAQQAKNDPYQDFAQSAAQAGLGVEDYLKYLTSGVSADERNKINSGLGIPEAYKQLFTPAPKTQDLYNNAYSQAGLGDLKAKIESKLAEVNKIQSLYTEKGGKINENPFLSEASRIGRLRVLDDKRLQEIGNLNNELQSMQDLYNNGVNEVNSVVSRSAQDFSNSQQTNALKLTYLQQQAEQQLQDLQGSKSQAAYKYLPDYLKAKAGAAKPDTIGNAETGYYRWNPATSTFEQVIAPKDNTLDNAYKMAQIQKLQQEIAGGGMNDLDRQYKLAQLEKLQKEISGGALTTEQKNKVASVGVLQQTINSIESLGAQIGWEGVGGLYQGSISQFLAKNFGKGSQQEQMLRSYIGNLQATIAKERGGTSFTANEQALLEQYTPTINDSPQVIQSKLAALKQYFNSSLPTGAQGNLQGNPSDPLGLFNPAGNASASTPYLKTLGAVTGENGSSVWSYGLDVDLKVGDPVKSPVSGTVIAAAPNGGFGNQVKIKTPDGQEVWLSHLDSGIVKVGQVVNAGQLIGYGGKTGNTIPLPGGDGSHLDITMKDASGKLLSAPQVKSFLDKIYV
jgi:murein DD-endopeptidase MepM/ murein hydrolase activator NlpD